MMQEKQILTGIVLSQRPIGEYDKRIVLLTRERGKISAFVRGARKPTSSLSARSDVFCYGRFKIYDGKNSVTVTDADIDEYFEGFRKDYLSSAYGMYFLEIADYYTRENNDEAQMLSLLINSLQALFIDAIPKDLVRYIYEIRSLVVNGEFPGIPEGMNLSEACEYAIKRIVTSDPDRLYTFKTSDEVLNELGKCSEKYRKSCFDKSFKSLSVLDSLSF